uniref:Uncharacterized protein n=1 Tax=Lepeophtheirus salmonis TaxID=72036 RepID=A0A0K2VHK1_LEPSM
MRSRHSNKHWCKFCSCSLWFRKPVQNLFSGGSGAQTQQGVSG